jgi:hypothetical protein
MEGLLQFLDIDMIRCPRFDVDPSSGFTFGRGLKGNAEFVVFGFVVLGIGWGVEFGGLGSFENAKVVQALAKGVGLREGFF